MGAAGILAHLAQLDSEGRTDALLDRYLAPIGGDEMIAAADRLARAIAAVMDANCQRLE